MSFCYHKLFGVFLSATEKPQRDHTLSGMVDLRQSIHSFSSTASPVTIYPIK